MLRLSLAASLLLSLTGCGAGQVTGEDDGTSSDTGDSDSDSATGDGESTGDTSDASDSTDADETDTGPLECPAPDPVTARFSVTPSTPLAAFCVVTNETSEGDLYELTLACEDGSDVTVSLDSTILRKPNPGASVEVDYRVAAIGPSEDRWLAIHHGEAPNVLILGAVSASLLDPPGTTLAEFFRDPALTVAAQELCEPTADSCGEVRRLALDVAVEMFGASDPVFDHGSWYADYLAFGYAIEVETATRRVPPVECDDVPDEWFDLLAVWFPSD